MQVDGKVGLVLEGGGFRGIYTAAVLDVFHRENIFFRYAIGVSAGAAYGVSYVSRQYQRNLDVNKWVADKRYCSLENLIRKGSYFDWDFVYKQVPLHLVPFDYKSFVQSETHMKVVVTNCHSGEAEYFDLKDDNPIVLRDLLAATSALPILSKVQHFNGNDYMDGGIADSIPVAQAFKDGNTRVVLVLTRTKGYVKAPLKSQWLFKYMYRKYPKMVETLLARSDAYNRTLREIDEMEKQGKVFVIRPLEPIAVSRIGNDPDMLARAYSKAVKEVEPIIPALQAWLSQK